MIKIQVQINTQDQEPNLGFPLILSAALPSRLSQPGEEFCETCRSLHGLAVLESSSDFKNLTLKIIHNPY
jgi:hypothetical protein